MINITQKKQMLKKELNSNAALITKSLLLNKNIGKSTNQVNMKLCYPFFFSYVYLRVFIYLFIHFMLSSFLSKNIL